MIIDHQRYTRSSTIQLKDFQNKYEFCQKQKEYVISLESILTKPYKGITTTNWYSREGQTTALIFFLIDYLSKNANKKMLLVVWSDKIFNTIFDLTKEEFSGRNIFLNGSQLHIDYRREVVNQDYDGVFLDYIPKWSLDIKNYDQLVIPIDYRNEELFKKLWGKDK